MHTHKSTNARKKDEQLNQGLNKEGALSIIIKSWKNGAEDWVHKSLRKEVWTEEQDHNLLRDE